MARTALVAGSASGIGKATAATLGDGGYSAIGIDLHDADIAAALSTVGHDAAGRVGHSPWPSE